MNVYEKYGGHSVDQNWLYQDNSKTIHDWGTIFVFFIGVFLAACFWSWVINLVRGKNI